MQNAVCVRTVSVRVSDLGAATDRTQQLGGVSHSGSAVIKGCGELGCLAEVVLRVLGRHVDYTCEHMEQG